MYSHHYGIRGSIITQWIGARGDGQWARQLAADPTFIRCSRGLLQCCTGFNADAPVIKNDKGDYNAGI